MIRIANGAGFLGDAPAAPRRLVESAEVDYLTLEYLAELTMSILAHVRRKDPRRGYAGDCVQVLDDLQTALREQDQLHIVSNGGGMNPLECVRAISRQTDTSAHDPFIAAVWGDELTPRLDQLVQQGCAFQHLDTGAPFSQIADRVVSANAYLGASPIVDALRRDARIVITGRVADASLTLGPAVHRFGWAWDDWTRLAAGTLAGHLIECGAQVTGGYSTRWEGVRLLDVGYPICELESDGALVITKPPGSGGVVDRRTVTEQLVYEIGDPSAYTTPDVVLDLSGVEVHETGTDRVRVTGAAGRPAPEHYKVSLAYHDGYTASAMLLVAGRDCARKARHCADLVLGRLRARGAEPERSHFELLGGGGAAPALSRSRDTPAHELVLRMAVADARREVVEAFTREVAPLITSGPAGIAGYAGGRAAVRPVFAFWPTQVPRELVEPRVAVHRASEWNARDAGHPNADPAPE